jgi:catechol 2,3-dioxygenase-like lactoylglutathione lyase family enzyme
MAIHFGKSEVNRHCSSGGAAGYGEGAMQVRFARHTEALVACVMFWRDQLGLPELTRFEDHAGYTGVVLDLPGTGAHLELTTGGGHPASIPDPESLVVLYLGDWETVRTRAAVIEAAPVPSANPYWDRCGLTFEDPDGFRVVLVAGSWPQ